MMTNSIFLYSAFGRFHSPASRFIRSSNHSNNITFSFYQRIERGNGKLWRTHENDSQVFVIAHCCEDNFLRSKPLKKLFRILNSFDKPNIEINFCLLYTSDAADERSSVDLG